MTDSDHIKEVFAEFGLALYLSQCLEHGIVNAMITSRQVERHKVTRRDIDAFRDAQFDKTLGALMSALSKFMVVPDALEADFRNALRKRNWLSHQYFRERATQFMHEQGRSEMIRELQGIQKSFALVDEELSTLIRPLAERHGVKFGKDCYRNEKAATRR